MARLTNLTESGMLLSWRSALVSAVGRERKDSIVMIRLSVPGQLPYRDLVLRVVSSSCKLLCSAHPATQEGSREEHDDKFTTQVVSAVSEVFNNIAIHGYKNRTVGNVELEIEMGEDRITLRLSDTGRSFDLAAVPAPKLEELPERQMGLFIVRSFMDEVSYLPANGASGCNVLTLSKRY